MSLFELKSRDERQEESRVKWIKNKCRGSLVAATGFGKTRVGLNCIKTILAKYPDKKVIIVVPTTALKDQWNAIIDLNGLSLNCETLVINTAIKGSYKCDVLIIDEIHRAAADQLKLIFKTIEYKYILGLTATFERLDGKHKLLEEYCPVFDEITIEEAKFQGWVSDYNEYLVLIDVDDLDIYNNYNKEFSECYEYFNYDFNLIMSLVGKYGHINCAKLRDKMCPNGSHEERQRVFRSIKFKSQRFMQLLQARKSFINNHPKKVEIARKIIEARPFSKIITFSNNIKMAESIGMGGQVYTGRVSRKKERTTIEEFNRETVGILHTVKKADEGLDVKGLSVGIVLGTDSGRIKASQRLGRVIRKEEDKKAEMFYIIINNTVESKWFAESHKNQPYITIDEEGLNSVLNGEEPKPYVRKIKDFTFRY